MGYGDDIIATGLARGFRERGKRAAFGDGRRIIWGPWSEEMFRFNLNIAKPGSEGASDLEWVRHYKGSRLYNKQVNGKWVWNYGFKVKPGEFFFTAEERGSVSSIPGGSVLMEPNVPWQKSVASNKDWGENNYASVATALSKKGYTIVQFEHKNTRRRIREAHIMRPHSFRQVLAALERSALYIGPEGGLHHGAAAVNTKAVVLFGGFIPPEVVGYEGQVCLTGGSKEACGNLNPCVHCRQAMNNITVDEVVDRATEMLR